MGRAPLSDDPPNEIIRTKFGLSFEVRKIRGTKLGLSFEVRKIRGTKMGLSFEVPKIQGTAGMHDANACLKKNQGPSISGLRLKYRIETYRLQYVSRSPDIRVTPCYEQYDMPTRTIISSTDHMRMASHQRFLPCVVSSKYYMRISGNYHFTQIT